MKKLRIVLVLMMIGAALLLSACALPFLGNQLQTCTVHKDLNRDGICDVCTNEIPVNCKEHKDINHDGKCDTKGCKVELAVFHTDVDHDGICDAENCTFTIEVVHSDVNNDGKCDICSATVEKAPCVTCVDANGDEKCDVCGKTVEKEPCSECVDANKDGKCDVCGGEVEVECDCVDANFDGKCDICKNKMDDAIAIISDGKVNFSFVLANGSGSTHVKAVDNLMKEIRSLGLTVEKLEDVESTVTEYEVLFGVISSRDEQYKLDPHVYGAKGYTVQLIDNKIIVLGGSDENLEKAIEVFKEQFLGITDDTKTIKTRYVYASQNVIEIQNDYRVNTITLKDEDIRTYTIAVDKNNKVAYNAALALQNNLYLKTGYWLDIVSEEEADKSLVITFAKISGGDGFSITVADGKIDFMCEYSTVIEDEIIGFFTKKFSLSDGSVNITEADNITKNVRDVFYKNYGAVGDGRTDDSEAIRAAHEYANQGGHTVVAEYNATYYIGKMSSSITVKTNVNWRNATFIIDDRDIRPGDTTPDGKTKYRSVMIFTIPNPGTITVPNLAAWRKNVNENGGLDASTLTKIDLDFGEPALVRIYNSNHKNYIRYGVNENDGASQDEVILVDKDGNIDPTTPLMFDYDYVSTLTAYIVDVDPITIEGGIFRTSPHLAETPQAYSAYERGLKCSRSNVTFKNVKHYLENEGSYNYNANTGTYGCPYGGFYSTSLCNNVVFENCLASAHVTYKGSNGAGMGTYDVSPGNSINVLYKNCYQEDANFFDSLSSGGHDRWGVMGSSGCKNVTFDGCKLTRFDAHNGIHNVNIVNSVIKHIRINGTGTFYMENTIMHGNLLIGLREDYGGFWDGNFVLKNNTMISTSSTLNIFSNTWYNHNFGYPAAFPSNIIIDGLTLYRDVYETPSTATVALFNSGVLNLASKSVQDYFENGEMYSDGTPMFVANKNQVPSPERIIIRNCENITFSIPDKAAYTWLENTVISVNKETKCTAHFDIDRDLLCDDCKAEFTPCIEHSDINRDGHCTYCHSDVEIPCDKHVDKDRTGDCDICRKDFTCPGHEDANNDHICDNCLAPDCHGEHFSANKDCKCDVCYEKLPCVDADKNNKCDVCEKEITAE